MNLANGAVAAGVMLAESDSLVRPLPGLLDGLGIADRNRLRAIGREKLLEAGQLVWNQGDAQTGIYLIGSGRIRSYYAAPSGREVTLAYWFAGNFVGGPDLFGTGPHMWTSVAAERSELSFLPGQALRRLALESAAHRGCPAGCPCIQGAMLFRDGTDAGNPLRHRAAPPSADFPVSHLRHEATEGDRHRHPLYAWRSCQPDRSDPPMGHRATGPAPGGGVIRYDRSMISILDIARARPGNGLVQTSRAGSEFECSTACIGLELSCQADQFPIPKGRRQQRDAHGHAVPQSCVWNGHRAQIKQIGKIRIVTEMVVERDRIAVHIVERKRPWRGGNHKCIEPCEDVLGVRGVGGTACGMAANVSIAE